MDNSDITNLMLLKAFRQCAHIHHHTGSFQGQGRILILLLNSEQNRMTQRELADITQRRAATLSEQLENMERAGLITREKCAGDKRNIDIRLTDKGRGAAAEAEKERKEIADMLFSKLSEDEKVQLYKLLLKLEILWQDINTNNGLL